MGLWTQRWFISSVGVACSLMVVFALSFSAFAQDDGLTDRERELQRELEEIERQIQQQENVLREERRRAVSLERDIAVLEANIQRAQLNIQAKNITIQQLSQDISARSSTIEDLEEGIEQRRVYLAHLLRRTNEKESFSLVEVLLSTDSLSSFFVDVNDFHAIKDSLHQTLEEIRVARDQHAHQREVLSDRQAQEIDARMAIEAEKRSIEQDEAEKQRLLQISENQAEAYQEELRRREQQAAEIRSALFALRDTGDIPFGEALEYARHAQQATGIRPAFLLAVFQQESGLRDGRFGVNVGTCNRPGDERGWRDIMPGPNDNSWRDDQTIYLRLMRELGRDPDTQPLSCPIAGVGGWGGAMGPAQFIPATWSQYQSSIANAAGVSVPDPWNPQHAFIASALYLRDLGAAGGGYTAERNAALRYYAGGNWHLPQNAFYGDGVMQNAANLQRDIDLLDEF